MRLGCEVFTYPSTTSGFYEAIIVGFIVTYLRAVLFFGEFVNGLSTAGSAFTSRKNMNANSGPFFVLF